MKFHFPKTKNTSGFTLIEVMISTGLFVVLMVLGVAAILNTNTLFKKNQTQRAVYDNIAFIVEDMSRLMRTGSSFSCGTNLVTTPTITPQDCLSNGGLPVNYIAFDSVDGSGVASQYVYQFSSVFSDRGLYRSSDGGASLQGSNPQFKISPNEVKFDPQKSGFIVRGSQPSANGDTQQPIIFVRLVGEIENTQYDFVTPFSYQFAITPRRIDS